MSTPTREQLEADIAATREQLGETVESLGHKMDVKGRARGSASAAARRGPLAARMSGIHSRRPNTVST